MKLLSPAGDFESLKMAIFYGANEVYLGIKNFNARNIEGFSLESLKDAVDFAHIYDVKVNLAVNILFSNNELQDALNLVVDAYNLGVDAFIIQDLGLASIINQNYPKIEIHASTQLGIHNLEGAIQAEKLGFKRIVLARETSLCEIKRIKENTNLEIEYFAHGALCVSFSGNCYLSSYLYGASGNRGKCKQLCRLPYTFEKNGKVLKKGFLLSAKDFNMINKLSDLKKAGVDVLKIEGRARRPFYVAISTKEYKNALNGMKFNRENLEIGFNRSFTPGYLEGNGNMISNYNNHIGIFVGNIEKVVKGKNFNEIFFSSSRELSPKSVFKTFLKGVETGSFSAHDLTKISAGKYRTTTTQKVNVGDDVNLIIDWKFEQDLLNFKLRKKIKINIFAKNNEKITAKFEINGKKHEIFGDICEIAKNQPITKNDLLNNFDKSELFEADLNIVELDNVFITKQKLNEFRRNVFDYIKKTIISSFQKNIGKIKIKIPKNINPFKNFQYIESINEEFIQKNIIFSPEIYNLEEIIKFKNKCSSLNKAPYLDLPNFATKEDVELLKNIVDTTKISIVANNLYCLGFKTKIVAGPGMNVFNSISGNLHSFEVITAESNLSTRINFPYMTLRHCPFKANLNATCKTCPFSNEYCYRMENGKVLKIKRKKLSSCTFYLI